MSTIIGMSPSSGATTAPPDGTIITDVTTGIPSAIPLIGNIVTSVSAPYGSVPNDVQAIITNGGRTLLGRMMLEGLSFAVCGFAVGTSGYDILDPTQSTGPPPGATALGTQIFPLPVPAKETVDLVEFPAVGAVSFLCRLETSEALAGLGELGLFVEILNSPLFPAEVGDIHLFALSHSPLQGKTDNHVYVQRIVIQF